MTKVRYDAGVRVSVDEEEAKEAFEEHADDFGWEDYEMNRSDAYEMAARLKLGAILDDEDIEIEQFKPLGVGHYPR